MAGIDDFAVANRAFDMMPLDERKAVLERFARLRFPLITDRFFDAVHSVVVDIQKAKAAPVAQDGEAQGTDRIPVVSERKPISYDDKQLGAELRPCTICQQPYYWTDPRATVCGGCAA